jgi:hypothetical protein
MADAIANVVPTIWSAQLVTSSAHRAEVLAAGVQTPELLIGTLKKARPIWHLLSQTAAAAVKSRSIDAPFPAVPIAQIKERGLPVAAPHSEAKHRKRRI